MLTNFPLISDPKSMNRTNNLQVFRKFEDLTMCLASKIFVSKIFASKIFVSKIFVSKIFVSKIFVSKI